MLQPFRAVLMGKERLLMIHFIIGPIRWSREGLHNGKKNGKTRFGWAFGTFPVSADSFRLASIGFLYG